MKENDAHAFTISRLQMKLSGIENDLLETRTSLDKETNWRETLQNQLHENRLKYTQERVMRGELERLNMKMRQYQLIQDVEVENRHLRCFEKLTNATTTMMGEVRRIKELSNLLPLGNNFGNCDLPTGRGFEWLFGDSAFTRGPPEGHHIMNKKEVQDKEKRELHTKENLSGSNHSDNKPRRMAGALHTRPAAKDKLEPFSNE